MANWQQIRVFLFVARHRTLSAAAAQLGIDHSTAFRRLKQLERAFGGPLFNRGPDGYTPTALGTELLPTAERAEQSMLALERQVSAQSHTPTGSVRISISDSLAVGYFPIRLRDFRDRFPDLRLDFSVNNQLADLSRHEAEIAIRPARRVEGNLVGRKVARMAYAGYAAPGYIERFGAPTSPNALSTHRICGYGAALSFFAAAQWLAQHVPESTAVMHFDNTSAMTEAAAAGIGVAIVPCFLGDIHPSLVRVIEPTDELTTDIWLLTHPDLRRSPRIRAVLDYLFETLSGDRALLEGRSAPVPASA